MWFILPLMEIWILANRKTPSQHLHNSVSKWVRCTFHMPKTDTLRLNTEFKNNGFIKTQTETHDVPESIHLGQEWVQYLIHSETLIYFCGVYTH